MVTTLKEPTANKSVERMVAGTAVWQNRERLAAAIAHFFRSGKTATVTAFQHVNLNDARKAGKRVWVWIAILTAIVCLYAVEYQITRVAVVAGIAATWTGALLLWWQRRAIRVVLLLMGVLPAIAACLPGRSVDADRLAGDYSRGLRIFRGVRYLPGAPNGTMEAASADE